MRSDETMTQIARLYQWDFKAVSFVVDGLISNNDAGSQMSLWCGSCHFYCHSKRMKGNESGR